MLNAEDTKERIRKLRLKVISDPTDINTNSKTQDVQKTTKGWEDKLVVKNENKETFPETETIGINEKQSNENKNLIFNKFKDFSNIKKIKFQTFFPRMMLKMKLTTELKIIQS